MTVWSARVAAFLVLTAGFAAQDPPSWILEMKAFCGNPNPSTAVELRQSLARLENPSIRHVVTSLRALLLQAQVESWKSPNSSSQALLKYLDAATSFLGSSVDHAKGLEAATAVGGEAGRLLAMAHLEHLLESGNKPNQLDEIAKKLKLKPLDGNRFAPVEHEELGALKRLADAGAGSELDRASPKSLEGKYLAVYGLLRAAEKDVSFAPKIRSDLSGLRALSAEHADALAEALKPFGNCSSCRGSRKVPCTMCKGQGEVEVVCPHCNGTGKIKLKDLGNSDTIRGRQPGSGVQVRTPSGEIVSVAGDETICPTCIHHARKKKKSCDFCQKAAIVECQRCKWQKLTLASIAKTEPCGNCNGNGFPFKHVAAPCAFCKGLGLFLIPLNAPSATIGPVE